MTVYVVDQRPTQVGEWRTDLRDPERLRPRRPARHVDQSRRQRPPGPRQRRIGRHQLRPGRDLGVAAPLVGPGQPYHASVDMRRPYYVCTGLQDNGSWCGPSAVRSGEHPQRGLVPRRAAATASTRRSTPTDYDDGVPMNPRTATSGRTQPGARGRAAASGRGAPIGKQPQHQHRSGARRSTPRSAGNWNTPVHPLAPQPGGDLRRRQPPLPLARTAAHTWTMSPDLTKDIDRDREDAHGPWRTRCPAATGWTAARSASCRATTA